MADKNTPKKLITETVEEVKYLIKEEAAAPGAVPKKQYYIEGIFLQANKKNRNGRIYPLDLLQREVARYDGNYIQQRRAFGELGHPESPLINLDRVSHMTTNVRQEGDNFIGKAKILDTPYGKIVKNFIDEGAKLGVSSRGLGTLRPRGGIDWVQDDYFLSSIADIVADPSAKEAFVKGIMENREWIRNEMGEWAEIAKKQIKEAHKIDQEDIQMRLFEEFMRKLSK